MNEVEDLCDEMQDAAVMRYKVGDFTTWFGNSIIVVDGRGDNGVQCDSKQNPTERL